MAFENETAMCVCVCVCIKWYIYLDDDRSRVCM